MSANVLEVTDQTFQDEVLQSDIPVLVDFGAPWCPPCRMIAPTIKSLAEKYAGAALVCEMNIDDNSSTAQRYGIKGIPTLILFKNGREEERLVGAASKETISRLIDKHIVLASA
ncbi:MAG: thioredoxin [Acidobacteria bacterium]|nr:thioredoxin [Acidobacteriota bacterium]